MGCPLAIQLILIAVLACAGSGIPALLLPRRSATGQRIALCLMVLGGLSGLMGAGLVFVHGPSSTVIPWPVLGSRMPVVADALSAFFMVPVLLMGALGSLYGMGYWPQAKHPENGRGLSFFWGLTVAGMILLLVARHAVLFLIGWELMAVAAYFILVTESHLPAVREAGWVYFVATHFGTLALFAMFALFHHITGSCELRAIGASEASLAVLTAIFFLALIGFGVKAGLMPLHFWLPAAHAGAPSHVSAIMSGVVLKIGIYGIVRFIGFLPNPPVGWGGVVLILGCLSGVLGVLFAIGQHDLKRLLAYHSVENIGIILMGFGVALLGRTWHQPLFVVLGMAGCLLHVWNHALFKSLLFLGAGSVIHASGTREIDRMGGLAKRLPWTAAFFLIGAVAICGLPPLNGFVSEWLIYQGLFQSASGTSVNDWSAAALAAPVLALIGALALACFVKAYGAVFLGTPRTVAAEPHEAGWAMKAPMAVLSVCCIFIGLFPMCVAPLLEKAVLAWDGGAGLDTSCSLSELAPLSSVALVAGASLILSLILLGGLARKIQWVDAPRRSTWGCGYEPAAPRVQYTASSFAQILTRLFNFVLHPHIHRPAVQSPFAQPSRFESHLDEPVLDRKLWPMVRFFKAVFLKIRPLQQGLTHWYLVYVALIVLALLIWTLPVAAFFSQWFTR